MPRQHCTNFPDIAPEKSCTNIEQKDKIVGNIIIKQKVFTALKSYFFRYKKVL